MCQGQASWPALGTLKNFQLPAFKGWGSGDTQPYHCCCATPSPSLHPCLLYALWHQEGRGTLAEKVEIAKELGAPKGNLSRQMKGLGGGLTAETWSQIHCRTGKGHIRVWVAMAEWL